MAGDSRLRAGRKTVSTSSSSVRSGASWRRAPRPSTDAGAPPPVGRERHFIHRSIANYTEKEFVDLVFQGLGDRSRYDWLSETVLNISGFPSGQIELLREVELARFPGKLRTDIDVLLWPRRNPAEAIAIQVKRIKVRLQSTGLPRINGLH